MRFHSSLRIVGGVILGNAITALGVAAFLLPKGIIAGGVTGLSLIAGHYFKIDISVLVTILNISLFLLGAFMLGRKFALTTIISTISYPVFLSIFRTIPNLDKLTSDTLLSTLFAGILIGFGVGVVLKMGASTGGMDIPSIILNKKYHIPIALSMWTADILILLGQVAFSSTEQVLYGVIMVFLCSLVINRVIVNGQQKIQLLVVSTKYQEIKDMLLHKMDVGLTMLEIERAYEGLSQQAVLCVVENRKAYEITDTILTIDKTAFIIFGQVNEVRGKGFTIDRKA